MSSVPCRPPPTWQGLGVISEAEALGAGLAAPLKKTYQQTYAALVDDLGCDVYVKTGNVNLIWPHRARVFWPHPQVVLRRVRVVRSR